MKPAFVRTPGPVPATPPTTFATALRRMRKRCHYSQAGLARMAGFDHSTVSRWEGGVRDITRDNIDALAEAMRLDPADHAALMIAGGYLPQGTEEFLAHWVRIPDSVRSGLENLVMAIAEGGTNAA